MKRKQTIFSLRVYYRYKYESTSKVAAKFACTRLSGLFFDRADLVFFRRLAFVGDWEKLKLSPLSS